MPSGAGKKYFWLYVTGILLFQGKRQNLLCKCLASRRSEGGKWCDVEKIELVQGRSAFRIACTSSATAIRENSNCGLVWTIPLLWSRMCSKVAAMSISLHPF